jgi:hypothetical protein
VSKPAMSTVVLEGGGPQPTTDDAGSAAASLREAVLAGPAAVNSLDEDTRAGAFRLIADPGQISAALVTAGHVDKRRRVLTGEATVATVLGLCLYSGEGYDSVLHRVVPTLPGVLKPGDEVPTGSALTQARARLHDEAMQALFTAGQAQPDTAAPPEQADLPGATAFGLELTVYDGTVFDLALTTKMLAEFAVPTGGRYPQARVVTLATCGNRKVRAAAIGSYKTSEQQLCDQTEGALGPGQLNLSDRNFFSMRRWVRFSATGAHLAWRVKNGARSLPAKTIDTLPDGSTLVRLHESDSMLARRRRDAGDKTLPRLPDTTARLVEFMLTVTDERGRKRLSRFRILTTLLDPDRYPAGQIAAVYAERWQAEVVYYRVKVTLRGPCVVLRGQTPKLARQEIWGMLVVYNALCDLASLTAASLGVDPDEISFVVVLRLARAHLSATSGCHHCAPSGPTQALLDGIAAQPRNRTGRQRTSPRTARQRRTEHTRDVTYMIEVVPSNLPKAA